MKKLSVLLFSALLGMGLWSCSDKDDAPVVGITTLTVTPQGSLIAYGTVIDQTTGAITNSEDPVAWDVTDAALAKATVKATATFGASVYYQGNAITEAGVEVDVNSPVVLEARDASNTVTRSYTLTVVRKTEAGDDNPILKSSSFMGFPANVTYYDMTMFKDQFYAYTVSTSGETINYDLFTSVDGMNWSKVEYTCKDADGADCVIGGEGARLAVINNQLLVLGGMRTTGKDKYGNEAPDQSWGMALVTTFRSFSSADGITFTDNTNDVKCWMDGNEVNTSTLATAYMQMATLGNTLYIKGGATPTFGMMQTKAQLLSTTDGKTFNKINALPTSFIPTTFNGLFFAFNNKLWVAGGHRNMINPANITSEIYSSTDGATWELANETLPAELTGLFGASVIVYDGTAYLIGGQLMTETENGLNSTIYSSTNATTWTPTNTPATFTARRSPVTVVNGNVGWIFGGYINPMDGPWPEYSGPQGEMLTDTWALFMK